LPSIDSLQAEFGKDGLTVLLVSVAEPREVVARAVAARGYAGRVTEAYRVQATPTVYLIGRDGMLLGRAIGPRPWTEPPGLALLIALLRSKSATGSGPE
jgi:hypothetical protein